MGSTVKSPPIRDLNQSEYGLDGFTVQQPLPHGLRLTIDSQIELRGHANASYRSGVQLLGEQSR